MDTFLWMWGGFFLLVGALLILDLGLFHQKKKEFSIRQSLFMSAFYILIAIFFGGWIWHILGVQYAKDYLTAFLVEKTLSIDNIFLISFIFELFSIPLKYQHRLLFLGVLGVLLLRGGMIFIGVTLVSAFSWVLDLFSLFLILTGIKMLWMKEAPLKLERSWWNKSFGWFFPVNETHSGPNFFCYERNYQTNKKKIFVTKFFLALCMIETVDLVFALDSIPAIFSLTTNPYIVYTSNIFAVLGLRSLYFSLAAIIPRFKFLKKSLALILIFIGAKSFLAWIFGMKEFPSIVSLGVTLALLGGGIGYSLLKSPSERNIL